jgi:TPR repeat protein
MSLDKAWTATLSKQRIGIASRAPRRSQAEYAIGTCYADGAGVEQDNVKAYQWIALSAAHGNIDAAVFQKVLAKKLTPEELTKAAEPPKASGEPQ